METASLSFPEKWRHYFRISNLSKKVGEGLRFSKMGCSGKSLNLYVEMSPKL